MSNRALREAAKAVERSKRASYGKDANTLSELLECVNTIVRRVQTVEPEIVADACTQMNEDEITQDVASNLVECFKTTAPAAYELLPRESLSLAGETIAYIAGIKLENAASSVTRKTKSPFEYWEEVLDCGLISGLQVGADRSPHSSFFDRTVYRHTKTALTMVLDILHIPLSHIIYNLLADKVLMGEVIIAPITKIWKSPLRSRLQIDFRVAVRLHPYSEALS